MPDHFVRCLFRPKGEMYDSQKEWIKNFLNPVKI